MSSLCFEAGMGVGGDLQQIVRRELLMWPWSTTPQHSPSLQLPPCRTVASPLIMAGFDPVRAGDRQLPVYHSTTERRSGYARNEPLIILDELETMSSSVPRRAVPEERELPPVHSRGDWEGPDVWRHHRHSTRWSPPTCRRRHHHQSSSSSSWSSGSSRERRWPSPRRWTEVWR